MLTFEVDRRGFDEAIQRTKNSVQMHMQLAVRSAAEAGRDDAKGSTLFKDRSGRLRSEIVARLLNRTTRSVEWEILSGAPWSRYVEEGTAPHDIRPKAAHNLKGPVRQGQTRRASGRGPHEHIVGRGRALRWVDGGTTHFAAVVHHPGTAPRPFMGQGYYAAERRIFREFELMLSRIQQIWN